ncbi:GNAT family N-acetyltransferase [Mesorhizobium sp. CAU 1732]|uniref:GNAT family N-acetyltransferase n=1 Tax=Mesorhizobium sp. CAU 1732 TaxID=3140358 RepID=UPI0032617FAE
MVANEITIRVATPADLEPLSVLIAASYATLGEAAYDREKLAAAMPLMSRANPTLLASGTYFIAETDGQIAGCGGWTFEKPGNGERVDGIAHIRHFATHPAHHRKGVARLLLQRCLDEAARAGATIMKSQSTLLAEPFYASAGFRRVRPIDVEMSPGIVLPVVEMERSLP